jgi:ATP-dependent DNA helicase PIF1
MDLSPEQKYAFEKFKQGENLFITGPGGTGKTKLIDTLVRHCESTGQAYQVCALTGCAAILLNNSARTLHSWTGI